MRINDELLTHLEDLSFFTLNPKEKTQVQDDLGPLIALMSELSQARTDDNTECVSPLDGVNIFRDDEVSPSYPREVIMQNAPHKNEEMIIAPKTVD